MDAAIEIRELSKYLHGRPAVDRLSLTVPPGSIFALMGDNGAGKTTTIRMLTGLLKPDAGSASILGLDCWQSAVKLRTKLGYVPEKPKFYDSMTVAEIGWFAFGFGIMISPSPYVLIFLSILFDIGDMEGYSL